MSGALAGALRLLARHWRRVYLASVAVTLVNTVPDVVRQVLVWDDPSAVSAAVVDVVGFLTGLVTQVWLTGALVRIPDGGPVRAGGALRRGAGVAVAAVRAAPGTVLAGVVVGGGVSALVTLPASIAALGWHSVLGPLGAPAVGDFALAALSDVVASALTLPFLALVLVLAARRSGSVAAHG